MNLTGAVVFPILGLVIELGVPVLVEFVVAVRVRAAVTYLSVLGFAKINWYQFTFTAFSAGWIHIVIAHVPLPLRE